MTNASTGRNPASAVGIGCSAGGLDALKIILHALPHDFTPPIFITIHRNDAWTSSLVDVLSAHTNARLVEPDDKAPILPGHVYIAPQGYHMQIERKYTIALSTDPPVCYCRPAIDVMLQTAAWAYERRLAALVLTGANEDGSAGLREVKAQGGLCIVQSPETAEFPTMPRNALATGVVDYVLDLEAIVPQLCQWAGGEGNA